MAIEKKRCGWCDITSPLYVEYHDNEWGVPISDDGKLFEMLILEGMQAGLSWLTILKKRANFRRAFDGFDYNIIAGYGSAKIESLLSDAGIIRNRLKIEAAVKNSRTFVALQAEFGSFARYLWQWVDFVPIENAFEKLEDLPAQTELSLQISKDLKKRGMNFVGPTIIYAFMQAVGVVNDHEIGCFRYRQCLSIAEKFRAGDI